MSHDGSGDAQVYAPPQPLIDQDLFEDDEDDFNAGNAILALPLGESSVNIAIFSMCLLYDTMVFMLLFMTCLIFMQVCTIFSSDGLEFYQNSVNYLKALYLLIILKLLHHYFDVDYRYVHNTFAARFEYQPLYKHFPTVMTTFLLALSYIKIVHEFYQMKANILAQQSYFVNGIKYVMCVFYINYFNLAQSVRDGGSLTRMSKLAMRYGVFASSLLIISQLGKYQYPESDPVVVTRLPFLDYFAFISTATIVITIAFVIAVKYFVIDYQLRFGNKIQELIWSMCMSHVLIHCFLETKSFLGTENEIIGQLVDLRFWAAMLFSVLITQITVIG